MPKPFTSVFAIGLLFASAPSALASSPLDHGIDSVVLPDARVQIDFVPAQWSADGEELWARGSLQDDSVTWMARFDSSGRLARQANFPELLEITSIQVLSPGHALMLGYDIDRQCVVASLSADLKTRWVYRSEIQGDRESPACAAIATGSTSEAALVRLNRRGYALKFAQDGHPIEISPPADYAGTIRAVQRLPDGSIVLGISRSQASGPSLPVVVMLDARGNTRWAFAASSYLGHRVLGFAVTGDGDLRVDLANADQVVQLTLTPLGAIRGERAMAAIGDLALDAYVVSPLGASLMLRVGRFSLSGNTPASAVHVSAEGTMQQFVLTDGSWGAAPVALRNGNIVAQIEEGLGGKKLLRFARGEEPRPMGTYQSDDATALSGVGNDVLASRGNFRDGRTWLRFREDGSQVAAPQSAAAAPRCGEIILAHPNADGSAFTVSDAKGHQMLHAIGPDQRALWSIVTPRYALSSMSVDSDRACLMTGSPTRIDCFARATGLLVQQLAVPEAYAIFSLPDGTLNVLGRNGVSTHLDNIDRSGQVRRIANSALAEGRFLDDGRAVLLGAQLIVLRTDGTEQFRYSDPSSRVLATPDGGILVISGDLLTATVLDDKGALRWRASGSPADAFVGGAMIGDSVLLDRSDSGLSSTRGAVERRIEARSLANGALRWTRTVVGPRWTDNRIATSTQMNEILVLSHDSIGHSTGSRVWRLDANSGNVLENGRLDCSTPQCETVAAWIDQRRRLNLLRNDSQPQCGWALERKQLQPPAPQALVGQAGINGIWYSPSADGQGFFVQYFPNNRTLFMPWFSYAFGGINRREDLRWFGMQGTVAADAREAVLQITRNVLGTFNAPPVTTANVVGSARFVMSDCNHGTLDYAIEVAGEEPVSGSLALQRLAGGFDDCNTSGGTAAGDDARPPANGFDAKQSGAWFQPSQSGQGMMLSVQPPTATVTGLLFGAWFTYDPAGQGDDPTAQHWFSIVGQTSNSGPPGQTRVAILRTLGGDVGQQATSNSVRVGEGEIRLQACAMTLDYRFDDSDVAGRFRGLAGQLTTEPVAPCAP